MEIKYLNETVDVDSLVQDNSYNYYDGGEFVVVGKLTDPSAPNPYFNVDISAKSQSGSISFQSESKHIICPRGYVIIEGDIMVPCCLQRRCPPIRPNPPTAATPPLLPASTIGGFVERMWAYQTIKKLLKASDLENENQEANRRKALQLSLQVRILVIRKLTVRVSEIFYLCTVQICDPIDIHGRGPTRSRKCNDFRRIKTKTDAKT